MPSPHALTPAIPVPPADSEARAHPLALEVQLELVCSQQLMQPLLQLLPALAPGLREGSASVRV